jgi:hypothetical protein
LTFASFPVAIFIRHRLTDSVLGVTEEFRAEPAATPISPPSSLRRLLR